MKYRYEPFWVKLNKITGNRNKYGLEIKISTEDWCVSGYGLYIFINIKFIYSISFCIKPIGEFHA